MSSCPPFTQNEPSAFRSMDSTKNHSEVSADWMLNLTRVAGELFLTDEYAGVSPEHGVKTRIPQQTEANLLGDRTEVSFQLEVSAYLRRC